MVHKRYTISTKISEGENEALMKLAERDNISISGILKLCSDALIRGEIKLKNGELKMCTPPHEDCVSDDDHEADIRYKELRFDRLLSAFERKGYPDEAIRRSVDQIISSVLDGPKYSARRSGNDWGC